MKQQIFTSSAPKPIGAYSQAIKVQNLVYLAGQIPLDPKTMTLVSDDCKLQVEQVFKNIEAVCKEAGGSLEHIVKLTIYLTSLANFSSVNETMMKYFKEPYPARTTIEVSALPKDALIEIEAMLMLP